MSDQPAPASPPGPPVVPPDAHMHALIVGRWISEMLGVVARLGVPQVLEGGPRTVTELADEVGAHGPTLLRVLRALTEVGVFAAEDGTFALTPLGRTLVPGRPGSLAALALMTGSDWQRTLWAGLDDAVRTGVPPAEKLLDGGMFGHLAAHPEDAEVFNAAMVEASAGHTAATARAYDFGRFGTLVDVGGGRGRLLGAILAAHPTVRGVLLDQPDVAPQAAPLLRSLGVADRCELVGGDFFESVPAGADGYVVSNVVHDWNDERALALLRTIRAAMRPDSVLLLLEWVLREGPEPDLVGKLIDVQMLVTSDGGERTRAEFDALLGAAGLRVVAMTRGNPGLPTLLEINPVP